jgi:hypothetical protein
MFQKQEIVIYSYLLLRQISRNLIITYKIQSWVMAIYRHYASKPEKGEQSNSNAWITISTEEERKQRRERPISRSKAKQSTGPGINLQGDSLERDPYRISISGEEGIQ